MPILESLSPILYRFGNEANRVPFQNLTSYVDLIDDIKDEVSLYETYYVRDGDRPDQLSLKFYNTTDFYWTFFLMNDHVRVQGWPLSNYQLEKKVKEDFPNTIFTTRNNLTGIFKVGETLTGNTSGASGSIIRRHLDLGQIVIKGDISFSSGETMTSSGGQSVTSTGFVREFNAVHHYEDANKKYIDIDPYSAIPSSVTAITNFERYIADNIKLKEIKVIKPSKINQISDNFRKLLSS